jgi:hypothetical protein
MTVSSAHSALSQSFPHAVVRGVIDEIGALGAQLHERAPELGQRIRGIGRTLDQEQITVNFGGVFKAGKSTMINAALGRDILPVDDVPETGAVCCLLPGAEDGAVVVEGAIRRSIPCTTEAIRSQITLLSERGERRDEVAAIDRAEITLTDCIIPRDACWVDSPGYNDTAEMDERTRRSAGYCDLLVWVLTSRQLLSQVEMTFLTDHVRHSGPASVVFVLNGFLRRDTAEEWQQFLTRSAPQLLEKVSHFAPDMGFPPEAPAQIIPVAGRAMCKHGQDTFGGTDLLRFLLGVDSRFHARVMRTRLRRAGAELKACVQPLEELLAAETADLNRRRSEWAAASRLAERKRQLAAALEQHVEQFLQEFSSGARARATEFASRLTDIMAASGGVYARQLNKGIAAAAQTALSQLSARVATTLKRFGEAPLSDEWTEYLGSVARPPETTLQFPERLEAGGIDALMLATPAFVAEKLGRPPQWLASVRAAISRVTDGVVAAMQARRAHFCEAFEQLYSLRVSETLPPDESALALLREMQDRLGRCAAEVARVAATSVPAAPGDPEMAVRGWKQGFAG